MLRQNQDGAVSGVAVSLILTIVLLIGAISFAAWAFSSREDYKNHTDAKIAVAVAAAKKQESQQKDAEFTQAEKNPLRTYSGPQAYGSIQLSYPKTWSGYVDQSGNGNGNALVDAYFYPAIVPSINDPNSSFALRVQVLNQSYSQSISSFQNAAQSKTPPTIVPYALPKVPNVVGVEVSGQIAGGNPPVTGTMVILPLRSETLEIWTEGNQFLSDFNNIILPNFTFSP